ncbi:putative DNA binding domain-containing protein [Bifidobacterium sp. LC6]|uniref:DNA binding domain-containing protein n=1 Tax=Bifidobacterium colobi TaxID=2809026 RepID=A0ABS5UTH6_9BIFI|nr:RNA-binding domain-containing protein [Bifidobacterium colobi]MBT1173959.1 putative DNA binding domain-containing protein [Bifidobacterium colobi]
MTPDDLTQVLRGGESTTVEFKRCGDLPHADTFETVCSFSNRMGGDIYLGIDDDGDVSGVDKSRVAEIERNIANVANNRKLFVPAPTLETEHCEYDGRMIIRIWVAPSSSVIRFKGVVYDRIADADIRLESDIQISQMYIRKQNYYSERRIFRYITPFDLRADLIARMRDMAVAQRAGHPWGTMSNDELFRSAKLYDRDYATGEEGFNLAAVLLLGKDEVISSVCPSYVTDALVRRDDVDRYDDRLLVRTNLFDAYDQLTGFVRNHLPDHFALNGDKRTSPREIISRELVANSLMHREYSSPVVARIIMDNQSVRTINASRSFFEGRMRLGEFTPMPKNPIIADVFLQTGIAEKLGSGLRTLIKAAHMYAGAEPEFIDGDIFTAAIPTTHAGVSDDSTVVSSSNPLSNGVEAAHKDAEVQRAVMSVGQDEPRYGRLDPEWAIRMSIGRQVEACGVVTVPNIIKDTGLDARMVRKRLNRMVEQGQFVVEGKTKNRRYVSTPKLNLREYEDNKDAINSMVS